MKIPDATMELFELDAMREIAEKLHLRSPQYTLSTFVQGKLFKVRDLIAVARRAHPAADSATDKLEKFIDELEQLQPEQVRGRADWAAFVTRCGVEAGWEGRLHFDHLLSNFGYDAKTARALQHARVEVTDQKGKTETVQLETHALRWLGKALACYQPDGCMADVVNLVFAMVHEAPPTEYDEATTVATLQEFAKRLAEGSVHGLKWIPTHLHIDGELDDSMSWMVLARRPGAYNPPGLGDHRLIHLLLTRAEPRVGTAARARHPRRGRPAHPAAVAAQGRERLRRHRARDRAEPRHAPPGARLPRSGLAQR